ncbi:OS-9-like protein [Drosera capensis]
MTMKMRLYHLISILVFLCFLSRGVVCDQILSVHTVAAHVNQNIGLSSIKILSPFQPDDDQESLLVRTKKLDKYLCFLPKVEKNKSEKLVSQQNTSSLIMETEKQVKVKTPDELLEKFKDVCVTRKEGWWTYKFCYHKKLRHGSSVKKRKRYHAHIYNNGTTCDLTNQSRETEVRFVCSEPKVMISSITELSTCCSVRRGPFGTPFIAIYFPSESRK